MGSWPNKVNVDRWWVGGMRSLPRQFRFWLYWFIASLLYWNLNCHRNPTLLIKTSTHSTLKIIMFLSLGIPELRKPTDAQKLLGIEKDISNPTLRKRIIISNIPAKICEFMEEVNQWFLAGTALRPGSHTRREPAQLNYQIREFQSSKCLITKWKNFFLHSVLGSSTTARYSLLLILTDRFVINACLAYLSIEIQKYIKRSIISFLKSLSLPCEIMH